MQQASRRAYLVLGPESSGTRLMTRILIAGGCTGDDGHAQRWDAKLPEGVSPIVWRRSVPHGGYWPDVERCIAALKVRGYQVTVVVTMRDWWAVIRSQVAVGHVESEEQALTNLRNAYRLIFSGLLAHPVDYVVVGYEGLAQRSETVLAWLSKRLGLARVADVVIYNGNAKHTEEAVC